MPNVIPYVIPHAQKAQPLTFELLFQIHYSTEQFSIQMIRA